MIRTLSHINNMYYRCYKQLALFSQSVFIEYLLRARPVWGSGKTVAKDNLAWPPRRGTYSSLGS